MRRSVRKVDELADDAVGIALLSGQLLRWAWMIGATAPKNSTA
jgi:hypothetical protein